MKAINLFVIADSNCSSYECGDKNCIGDIPVSYDKDLCICLIIFIMRYNQHCCGFRSVVSKPTHRNNLTPHSIIYSL